MTEAQDDQTLSVADDFYGGSRRFQVLGSTAAQRLIGDLIRMLTAKLETTTRKKNSGERRIAASELISL